MDNSLKQFLDDNGHYLIFLIPVLIFIFYNILNPNYTVIRCTNKYAPCVASANFMGIRLEKRLYAPTDIISTDINHYQVRRKNRKRHKYSVSTYRKDDKYDLYFVNKAGKTKVFFKYHKDKDAADKARNKISDCFIKEQYPCIVEKY